MTDYKTLYEKLTEKLGRMRALQRKRDARLRSGNMLPRQDYDTMKRLERDVDKMLLLDEQGQRVYLKNN